MEFFSADYFESREKFRRAVKKADGLLEIIEHPSARGPNGEQLTTDVAVFGPPSAKKVFFNVNGVHGIESYSGAAAQLQFIQSGTLAGVPDDICIVLIHNINPFGWAHNSQRNEDLMDLNRNFVDFDDLPESDPLHFELAKEIAFEEFSFAALGRAWSRIMEFSERVGPARFNGALMVGQYIAPTALKYGGSRPAWSNLTLRAIAQKYLSNAEKIAYLDWHTGLGDYAEPYELHTWSEGSEAWQRTAMWWGEAAVRRGGEGLMSGGASDGDASTAAVNGMALRALQEAAPHATIGGGPVEFGTVSFDLIAQAAILDHWMMLEAADRGLDVRFWKAQLRALFAPRDPIWENSVLNHASGFYDRMLTGLAAW